MLVEATTTDSLVAKLKTQSYRSFETIQEKSDLYSHSLMAG